MAFGINQIKITLSLLRGKTVREDIKLSLYHISNLAGFYRPYISIVPCRHKTYEAFCIEAY